MIVCVCNRISHRDIEKEARAGCSSFDELQMELGVATCCGSCTDCARTVFAQAKANASAHGHHSHTTVPLIAINLLAA